MMLERSGATHHGGDLLGVPCQPTFWHVPRQGGREEGKKQRALSEEGLAVEVLPFSEYAAAPNLLEGDGFAA